MAISSKSSKSRGKQPVVISDSDLQPFAKMFGECDWWVPNGKKNFFGIMRSVRDSRPHRYKHPEKTHSLQKALGKRFGDKIFRVRIYPTPGVLRQQGIIAVIFYRKQKIVVGIAGRIAEKFWADIELNYEDLKIPRLTQKISSCFYHKIRKSNKKRYHRNYSNRPRDLRLHLHS